MATNILSFLGKLNVSNANLHIGFMISGQCTNGYQMAILLGYPVEVLPAAIDNQLLCNGSELICILSNGASMFQVPLASLMYTRKRLSR